MRRMLVTAVAAVAAAAAFVGAGISAGTASATPAPNSGQPGSACVPHVMSAQTLEPGTSSTALGPAPAYYEWGPAAHPKGVAIFVHGGGWYAMGPGAVVPDRGNADMWRSWGYDTLVVDYPACNGPAEIATLKWFYDAAARFKLPVGATGESSGGNLVLLLAEQRPLAFAIPRDGPTDLTRVASQPAYDPSTGHHTQYGGPALIYNWAVAAFGKAGLAAMSPALHQGTLHGKVLQPPAWTDVFVPIAQWGEIHVGKLDILNGPGPVGWIHGTITVAAMWRYFSDLNAYGL